MLWVCVIALLQYRAASQGVGSMCAIGGFNGARLKTVECYSGTWQSIASMTSTRQGGAATKYNGQMCALGGNGVDSLECYNGAAWQTLPAMSLTRIYSAAAVYGGQLCVVGGSNGGPLDSVECYDGSTWSAMVSMNVARGGLATVIYNGALCAIGGNPGYEPYLTSVECYNGSTWEFMAPMNTGRFALAAVVFNGDMCAIGGSTVDGGPYHSTVECFNGVTWEYIAPMPTGRDGLAAVVYAGELCVLGGWTGSPSKVAECYDGSAWRTLAPMGTARQGVAAVIYGDTATPTDVPTAPTVAPTDVPTATPTSIPTTPTPTVTPTDVPTAPTVAPTDVPTGTTWSNNDTLVINIQGSNGVVVTASQDPAWGGEGVLFVGVGLPIMELPQSATPLSAVISIEFYDLNGSFSVSGLSTPILIEFPLLWTNSSFYDECEKQQIVRKLKEPTCVSRAEGDTGFTAFGCNVHNVTATAVVCACTHLTEFMVVGNTPSNQDVRNLSSVIAYPTPLITVCSVLAFFSIASIGAALVDTHKHKLAERKRQKWELKALSSKARTLPQSVKSALRSTHPWLAVFFRPTGSSFSSKDRCLCLLVAVFFNMCVTAAAWQPHRQKSRDVLDRVINDRDVYLQSILASFVAAIIRQLLETVFSRAGPLGARAAWRRKPGPPPTNRLGKCIHVCAHTRLPLWVRSMVRLVCVVSVLGMGVVITLFGLQFDLNARFFCNNAQGAVSWIRSFCITTLTQALLVTPAFIVVKECLLFRHTKRKGNAIETDATCVELSDNHDL